MLLLKQKMFLGVPSVVRMTTRWGKDKISWHDDYKQTQTFNFYFFFVLHHLILSGNYGSEIRHGIFWGSIFGPGIFMAFVGSPRDFFGF